MSDESGAALLFCSPVVYGWDERILFCSPVVYGWDERIPFCSPVVYGWGWMNPNRNEAPLMGLLFFGFCLPRRERLGYRNAFG
jgi:hypothetical protein